MSLEDIEGVSKSQLGSLASFEEELQKDKIGNSNEIKPKTNVLEDAFSDLADMDERDFLD